MNPDQLAELARLLESQRILALGVLVDDQPYTGLLPYALTSDRAVALVYASGLARHTRGLLHGAPFSVLIHRPDHPKRDPLQIERVMLQGTVEILDKARPGYRRDHDAYVARFPSSEQTVMLADFRLYRLHFEQGRYVSGFAQAVNVTAKDLTRLGSNVTP